MESANIDMLKLLTSVRDAYRNIVNGKEAISEDDYLALLCAFEKLADVTTIPESYETDFRRNLPGGSGLLEGTYDEVVGTLKQKISSARKFAEDKPLYPSQGEFIVQNLIAIVPLAPSESVDQVLGPMQSLLEKITKKR